MEWLKLCAVMDTAGETELTALTKYAIAGWNIAFMDPDEEAGYRFKKVLKEKYNINVHIVNGRLEDETEEEYDIEGFFYNGSWEDEEDIDIYRGFIEGKYGGVNYVIEGVSNNAVHSKSMG
ncbi:MAG: hypothetical protein LBV33_02530 [Lachnospiraceae bacterium]|jgi:hypothetical protein|nr:hypothetical protein [Lachnospiraceae bacterium]